MKSPMKILTSEMKLLEFIAKTKVSEGTDRIHIPQSFFQGPELAT